MTYLPKQLVATLLVLFTIVAAADPPRGVTLEEFRALAADLAPKVNLFRAIWAQDPEAELFGGTSRDFLYWIKGKLNEGMTAAQLRALDQIDAREFIAGDSDVDILTSRSLDIDARQYAVRKIDPIDRSRLSLSTEAGRTERDQGYIPVEKIRLSRTGVVDWERGLFGDGVKEVYELTTAMMGRLFLAGGLKDRIEAKREGLGRMNVLEAKAAESLPASPTAYTLSIERLSP